MNPPETAIINTETTRIDRVSLSRTTLAEALRYAADYLDAYDVGGTLAVTPLSASAIYHQGPTDIPHWTVELIVIAGAHPLADEEQSE